MTTDLVGRPSAANKASSPADDGPPTSVVFIDSDVPDLQQLIDGAKPGEQVFVINSSSDGVQQIAAILAANDLTNLSSISIVGHGSAGAIQLGSTTLDAADLSSDAAALSQIGASLAPGGDLALYSCDTAAGAAGQQFIADLSAFAGGVDVAAATHLVGAADQGGSWTLDASTGAPVTPASAPFTQATLANYQGELSASNLLITTGTTTHYAIYVSNGTSDGMEVGAGSALSPSSTPAASNIADLTTIGSDVFFAMRGATNFDWTLYEYNGTNIEALTSTTGFVGRFLDPAYGGGGFGGYAADTIAYNGNLVFSETSSAQSNYNSYGFQGTTLAVYDPSTQATTQISGASGGYNPSGFVAAGGDLYYLAYTSLASGASIGLYEFNGTTATHLTAADATLNSAGFSNGGGVGTFTSFNGNIYFSGYGVGTLYEYNTTSNLVSTVTTFGGSGNVGGAGTTGEIETSNAVGNELYITVGVVNASNTTNNSTSGIYELNTGGTVSEFMPSVYDTAESPAGYVWDEFQPVVYNGDIYFEGDYLNGGTQAYGLYESTNGTSATKIANFGGQNELYLSNGVIYTIDATNDDQIDAYNISNGETSSFTYSSAPTIQGTVPFAIPAGLWTVGDVPPCFAAGTRILTDCGEVEVENLAIGDRVVTTSGKPLPVKWIGHRALDCRRYRDPSAVWPVRVAAAAFGDAQPSRDLWLSPGHCVADEGVLIPIRHLVNGRSIVQVEVNEVEYWHVELDEHDILLAEGLPAESYLDCGNRAAFANGGVFIEAHPDFEPKHCQDTCLPHVTEGPKVAKAKARLLARLFDKGLELTDEANAHILADGQRIAPIRLGERRLAFALPEGCQSLVLKTNTFVPAHASAESSDERELGLCVARLQVDGDDVSLEDAALFARGWHEPEIEEGRFARRWTRGAVLLPAGARLALIDLCGRGYYWRDPSPVVIAHIA